MGKVPALVTSAWKGRAMKGRTLWIAMVLAGLCLLAPGAAVADEGQATAGFWMPLLGWLASLSKKGRRRRMPLVAGLQGIYRRPEF